ERSKILKEAEILHKARFSYILPILGICNEPEYLGIVTEYMSSGSLNQLLHEDNPHVEIVWQLRFRILYEIALGVNFLHNMTPSLLHHDLKTQNILLDNEFHAKIADFGLSKWRKLSSSHSTSDQSTPGGTIIYMPPEEYEPSSKARRGSVKHDMYSYAIIMWEVLARKEPYEGAENPMQIMFSVFKGKRPDISEESLPSSIPHREVFIPLMQSGWATDPNDRPAFMKCLQKLEPLMRLYDDISILEGILEIKKRRSHTWEHNVSCPSTQPRTSSPSPTFHSSNEDVHRKKVPESELFTHDAGSSNNCNEDESPNNFGPFSPVFIKDGDVIPIYSPMAKMDIRPIYTSVQESPSSALQWIKHRRQDIIQQMTDACLNQCLDALISHMVILREDYELIKSKATRSSKVRQLIDTCDAQGEVFARVIVQKLRDNRQNDLKPFPEI
ncbi:hypothetical protein GDO86_010875, partial [Hymenochirus boettgeri]